MEKIRNASEDEMVLAFLSAEISSERFSEELKDALRKLNFGKELITEGDLSSEAENLDRKKILGEYRGYPDRGIFDNYPENTEWIYAGFSAADLDSMRYIDYSYWNELSKGTSMPSKAAETIRDGTEVFGVSNKRFIDAADALDRVTFPPVILLGCNDKYFCLEGHLRLTAYALRPEKFDGAYGYIGLCSESEMMKKEPKMLKK